MNTEAPHTFNSEKKNNMFRPNKQHVHFNTHFYKNKIVIMFFLTFLNESTTAAVKKATPNLCFLKWNSFVNGSAI